MYKDSGKKQIFIKLLTVLLLFGAIFYLSSTHCSAQRIRLTCQDNSDPMSNLCTIYVNSITKKANGKTCKGHTVGCQFKSFSCINNVCTDNFGTRTVSFDFPMHDHARFCQILCKNPACEGKWMEK